MKAPSRGSRSALEKPWRLGNFTVLFSAARLSAYLPHLDCLTKGLGFLMFCRLAEGAVAVSSGKRVAFVNPLMLFRPFLLIALLASPALAASALETLRAGATGARDRVVQLRSQQMAQRSELNGLAARIEALKAERKVLRAGELEGALRRSQELSGSLTVLAQSLAAAEGEAQKQNVALLNALSQTLTETRQRYDALPASDRNGRRATLESMRKMRAERDRLSAQLPAALVPALDRSQPSDDPEDLLEQADLLRDNQDKVKRELATLERRIRDVREERELDRRMNDFAADESMFDESDRRLRLQVGLPSGQGARGTSDTPSPQGDTAAASTTAVPEASSGASSEPGFSSPVTTPSSPSTGGSPSVATPLAGSSNPRSNATGQPFLGRAQGDFRIESEELDDLGALENQRKRLSGLADELGRRAKEMEARAKSLR